jgi:hypothetical protein
MATWTNYDYDNIYTQEDGTRIFLSVKEWAELTLTGDDLAEWETDYATIQAYENPLIAADTLASTPLTTVTISDNRYNTVQGKKIRLESDTDSAPTWHALWDKWADRMQLDSNVTWIAGIWKLGNFVD